MFAVQTVPSHEYDTFAVAGAFSRRSTMVVIIPPNMFTMLLMNSFGLMSCSIPRSMSPSPMEAFTISVCSMFNANRNTTIVVGIKNLSRQTLSIASTGFSDADTTPLRESAS